MTEYIDQYRDGGIYEELEYGAPGVSKGVPIARFACQALLQKKSRVLCIGCGCGYEVLEYLYHGHDACGVEVHEIDVPALKDRIFNEVVPNLPFHNNAFDLVHCTEVLEHIEPEETDAFLKECRRLAPKAIFSIADRMDSWKTHINIQSPGWWVNAMTSAGYSVKNLQWFPEILCVYENMLVPVYFSQGYLLRCE